MRSICNSVDNVLVPGENTVATQDIPAHLNLFVDVPSAAPRYDPLDKCSAKNFTERDSHQRIFKFFGILILMT